MTPPSPEWFPDWTGRPCIIIASGPSAVLEPIPQGVRTIAVNNSWQLAPWADVLYASDAEWWQNGSWEEFGGLKVSRSGYPGVRKVSLRKAGHGWCNDLIMEPGVIGAGGSSAFQALNLALQFGSRKLAMVGCDCRLDLGVHWHGSHVNGLKDPYPSTAAIWRRLFDAAAPQFAALGAEVVNCSPVSALTAYPKTGLAETLERWSAPCA